MTFPGALLFLYNNFWGSGFNLTAIYSKFQGTNTCQISFISRSQFEFHYRWISSQRWFARPFNCFSQHENIFVVLMSCRYRIWVLWDVCGNSFFRERYRAFIFCQVCTKIQYLCRFITIIHHQNSYFKKYIKIFNIKFKIINVSKFKNSKIEIFNMVSKFKILNSIPCQISNCQIESIIAINC